MVLKQAGNLNKLSDNIKSIVNSFIKVVILKYTMIICYIYLMTLKDYL